MKPTSALSVLLTLSLLSFSAIAEPPPGHPAIDQGSAQSAKPTPLPLTEKAKVLRVANVPNYTYLEVVMDQGEDKKPLWLAGPSTDVKVGDTVRFDKGTLMTNFPSAYLKRDFAELLFVSYLEVVKE